MSKQEQRYQYKEQAINLIAYNANSSNYEFTQEAKDLIVSVQGAIGVISVAGLYRTGKSYLLNRMLLNRSNGFGVGPTVNAYTKGLWIWGKPILGQTKNGESINVFIIDSEGIGSVDVNQDHDNKIFALTVLLSSTFIYNSIGAIDESAIQNLSLIVNLTQNIHIKSQQDNCEVSEEDYSAFFPTFIWTVRDFSLQLTDMQGDIMDSKQYLEKQLQLQKGNSKEVEQKNKVRKSLIQYFKDRDCFCMFRPSNNEQDLQNLDKIEFEKLRPEFIEQIIQLRKRVLNNVRPKQLNGQNLSGEMYCDLIKSYVNAINSGACPNIEDAWLSICNNECGKAQNQGIDLYQKLMAEVIDKLPCDVRELKEIHQNSKMQAFKYFKKKALGNLQQQYIDNFQQKVKQIYQLIKSQNNKELDNQCQGYINSSFIQIERKLRNNEYQSFYDFDIDCQNFKEYFMKNGPQTDQKKEIVLEFLIKQLREGVQLFLRSYQEQANMHKVIKDDTLQKMQKLKQDMEIEINQERQKQQNLKSQFEQEKKEQDSKIQISQNQIISIQQDFAQKSYSQMNEHMTQKSNLNSQILELNTQLQDQANSFKLQEEQFVLEKTDFEKEKLLLDQKIIYLEKGYEEFQQKEKQVQNNMRFQKSEVSEQIKDIYQKNDKQVKELQQIIKELQEINIDLESNLSQISQQYEISQRKSMLNETQNQTTIQQFQKDMAQLLHENKQLKLNEDNLQQQLQNLQSMANESLNQSVIDLEIMVKNKDEQIKQQNNQVEKDKAVFQQKNQFLELQMNELTQQVNVLLYKVYIKCFLQEFVILQQEHKKQSENLLSTFELKSNIPDEQHQQKLNQIQEQHQNDMSNLQYEMENQQKRLYDQIKNLTETISDNELQNKLSQNDQIQQISKLKEQLENSENQRQKLFEKTQFLENNSKKITKDCEERYNLKLKDCEQQMEDMHGQHMTQNLQMQEQSEENINQLKQYYLLERDRFEKRSLEEKKRQEKSILQIQEDNEQKTKELTDSYEENIENLQQQLKNQEQEAQNIINQYEYEIVLKDQQIKNLDQNKEDMRLVIANQQNSHSISIEQLTNNYNQDKNMMQQKMELQIEQCLQKDKEMAVLTQKCESQWEQITKTEYESQNKEKEHQNEKLQLQNKIQELNQINKQISEELLEKKIKLSRDIALKNQENEFAQKKIVDLQNQLQAQQEQIDEKISNLKLDLLVDFKEKQQKLQEQKEYLEQKLEKNRKQMKEQDLLQQQEIQKLSHDNISQSEYIKNNQSRIDILNNAQKQEQESLQYQLQQYKQNLQTKEKEFQTDFSQLKESYQLLKQQHDETLSNYDKDKALWDHKYQFLEQQRHQYKQELQDQRKKFETTLILIRKQKSEIDNEKTNQQSQELVQNLEKKYLAEIQQQQDELNKQKQYYEQKIQKLEKQLKDINEQNMIEDQQRKGNNSYNEKKLYELLDTEKKLLIDIDVLKQERDNKNLDFQKILDNEREKFNSKILQYENKIRESEYKKQQQFFEHEKQRASWQQERDYLITQKEDVQDQLEYIGRKRDALLKENEKFKIDQKQSRKANSSISNYQPIGFNSRFLKMSPISGKMKISSTTDQSDLFDNQKYEHSPINLSNSIEKKNSLIKKN